MATPKKTSVGRRGFLKGAAGAAAILAEASGASAQKSAPQPTRVAAAPDALAATENRGAVPSAEILVNEHPGSDFMVEVIKSLGFEYCCANPGSAFRALHESIINYGGNSGPELITCCHEESAVAMAHGFAKIEGKPMAVFLHSDVGLQHGSMGIYNEIGRAH